MGRLTAAFVALGFLTVGLAGCAHEKLATDSYRWAFLADAGEAPRLAFGRPASDDVILMLSCSPGADRVHISALGLSGGEIVLASGRAESRFPASRTDNGLVENGLLEACGKMSGSALAGFQLTGELAILIKGERHRLDVTREDRGQVQAFFRTCRA